ncbi:hypothetical protein [Halalkalicoccus salilacus]|uniref:hypothetical protein n=1 Tax=Halalkalicoccus salilacus TaxID=3117459 RepID=UPI00300E9228
MRIIIEIDQDEGTETAAEIREEVGSPERSHGGAVDAGAAPGSRSTPPEGSTILGSAREETPKRLRRATDAGAAPEPPSVSAADEGTNALATDRATDAGAAPKPGPSPTDASSPDGGFDEVTPDTTFMEGTNAGPPPASLEGGPAVGEAVTDYEAVVSGTIEEVKDRVEGGDLDVEGLLRAERSGESRTTLLDWLEGRS